MSQTGSDQSRRIRIPFRVAPIVWARFGPGRRSWLAMDVAWGSTASTRAVAQNASFIPPTTLRGAPAKIEPVVEASTLAPFCNPVTALIEFASGWAEAM
jgi:hypothetical protein